MAIISDAWKIVLKVRSHKKIADISKYLELNILEPWYIEDHETFYKVIINEFKMLEEANEVENVILDILDGEQ